MTEDKQQYLLPFSPPGQRTLRSSQERQHTGPTRRERGEMLKPAEAATPKQAAASGSPASSPDGGDGQRDSKAAAKEKTARSKSFADTLASRPERSLAERYNVERFVPEDVIAWSVRNPMRPHCRYARRGFARSRSSPSYCFFSVACAYSSSALDTLMRRRARKARISYGTRSWGRWTCGRCANRFSSAVATTLMVGAYEYCNHQKSSSQSGCDLRERQAHHPFAPLYSFLNVQMIWWWI